ncbi:MAG: hypothetical protein Q9M48_01400 [Rhodobacterales bacterium]|nr:hypothetical protein [Rhodobacterales bacterium]
MPDLLAMLALYYLCDSTAALRGLDSAEVAACMSNYEVLKVQFAADSPLAPLGSPERARQNRRAYAKFKAWEAENHQLVTRLRQNAARQNSDL